MAASRSADLVSHPTPKFHVLGGSHDRVFPVSNKGTIQRKGIFLDINDFYTQKLIQKAFVHPSRAQNFQITLGPGHGMDAVKLPADCSFQWAEYERIDWDAVLAGRHGASSYCIRKGLSRKAQLAYYTHRHVCKNPHSILKQSMPKTVVLDTWPVWEDNPSGFSNQQGLADIVVTMGSAGSQDGVNRRQKLDKCLVEARKAMEKANQDFEKQVQLHKDAAPPVWILKGSTVNKGAGIYIVHLYEQVVDICWSEPDIREWVLQHYIANPLLLRKRKFHIRAYALAVSALRVYFCTNCLALCAGTRYRENDTKNLFAHITNTAYQDLDPNFREENCVLLWDKEDVAPILVRDGICSDSTQADERIRTVVHDMEAITAELFRAYESEFGVFAPIEGCFEHYGLDFIVDEDFRVYLLEVNPGPDFKQTGHRLQGVIENLMGSTIDVALMEQDERPNARSQQVCCLSLVYENKIRASSNRISMKVS